LGRVTRLWALEKWGIMKKLLLLLLIVTATITVAHAQNPKLSPELQGYTSSTPVQVIVQYAPGTTPPGAQQANCGGLLGLVDCAGK
jgi:hypothetical protein